MRTNELVSGLHTHVEYLAAAPREPGSKHHTWSRGFIKSFLESQLFAVREVPFTYRGHRGINLFTEPIPKDRPDLPLVIVGAHYDTARHDVSARVAKEGTSGADDNASGVVGMEFLAKRTMELVPEHGDWCTNRVQFVAYDLEENQLGELGCIGSRWHVEELLKGRTDVSAAIILEMIGYADATPGSQKVFPQLKALFPDRYPDDMAGDFIGIVGNERSRSLVETVAGSFPQVTNLPVQSLVVPGNGDMIPDVRRSDHQAFWDWEEIAKELGICGSSVPDALMVTDTSEFRNPHYHAPTDRPETLDYVFMAAVVTGLQRALVHLLFGSGVRAEYRQPL